VNEASSSMKVMASVVGYVIAQQCRLKNGRQPSQWGIKESNYKVAKRKQKTDAEFTRADER